MEQKTKISDIPPGTRVFSGMQPTGEAHLGNYLGALRQWVTLQDRADCIYCIVDYHAITVPYEPATLPKRTFEMAVQFLAAGLDPDRCTIFVQSDVPEHTELAWILNTVTPLGELERMTQFKDKASMMESVLAGLLNYPVLQAADILLYRATMVPVGEDQVQHLELTREIARRWNRLFGEYFPEPQPLIGDAGRIRGLDGEAKMSKSRGNTVGMLDDPATIHARVRTAVTDPQRVRRNDPGRPEVCNVYTLHRFFTPAEQREAIGAQCRAAEIGCVECKRILAEGIARTFEPMRERAAEYRAHPERVREILGDGAARCRRLAQETMREVRERMGLGQVTLPVLASR
ncbi:MAG TPA: tryptophan--tRNA ligase [Longimicrobiales bacterium]|nr:tryptophan--tRNA ligase [Longimicrobiales bacterium]